MTTWIPPHRAAERLGVDLDALRALIADESIDLKWIAGDHYSISEESVTAYLERSRIPVGEGPEIGPDAEREFRDSQADYTDDTPDDEGDDQQ